MTDIQKLQAVIKQLHGCEALHVSTIPVHEQFQGKTVWSGDVELFDVQGHPKAKRCYAWSYLDDAKVQQFTTVLELPPVTSAQSAVKADIVARFKNEN